MAKLTMAQRKALPKSDFAVPSKAPGPGSYGSLKVKAAVKKKAKAKGFAPMHKQVAKAMLRG